MFIETFNIKVIRFTDEQVGGNVDRVVENIKKIVKEMKPFPPSPLAKGEENVKHFHLTKEAKKND